MHRNRGGRQTASAPFRFVCIRSFKSLQNKTAIHRPAVSQTNGPRKRMHTPIKHVIHVANFGRRTINGKKGISVKYSFWIAGLCIAGTVGLGCGGSGDKWTANQPDTVDASGIVLLDGEPIEGATVVFGPVDGKYPANAITASDGSFSAAAFTSKPGAVPGKYKVALTKTVEDTKGKKSKFDPGEDSEHAKDGGGDVAWTNGLPEIYKLPSTTPIEIEVPSDGVSDLKIEMSSK